MLANFKHFKLNFTKTIIHNLINPTKIQFSFCRDKQINDRKAESLTSPRKKFLQSQHVDSIKNEQYDLNQLKEAQNQSFNHHKSQRMSERSKIRVKSMVTNPGKFLFDSQFHKNGVNLQQKEVKINQLDDKIIEQSQKQELIKCLKQINEQRKQILSKGITRDKISQHLSFFIQSSKNQSGANNYIQLYIKISSIIEKIITSCQNKSQYFHSIHYFVLQLISEFFFVEFYVFYLFKLIRIKDKQTVKEMSIEQAKLCWFIAKKLSTIDQEFKNNTLPYDLQRYVNEFFDKKLEVIYARAHHDIGFKSDKQGQLQLQDKLKHFQQGLSFMLSIEKIFKITHLTFGKHKFISNFVKKNMFVLQASTHQKLTTQKIQNIVELFNLAVQNLYLDKETITRFQTFLIQTAQKSTPKTFLNQRISQLLFQTYEKLGSIPDIIYDQYLSQYIYTRVSIDQFNLVQCIKFYIYAQCDDRILLQSFFSKLESLAQAREFITNKKSRHLLHFLFHSLCIQYPSLKTHQVSKKMFTYCKTHTEKDHVTLSQIMKFAKNNSRQQQRSKQYKEPFFSYCIQWQTRRIQNNNKSKLSTMQQRIFKESLQQVITKLNSQTSSQQFYQIKQQFSFCSFQLDFIILKWNSPKREKLLGYLDTECVGLQYSYDKNQNQNEEETAKIMEKMSLVEYEKGLRLIRKKMVRQEILRHYGFKVLYVPNKFLYQRHMGRGRFVEKLKEAIVQKFQE